jgi:hypothetical protein
MSHQRPFLGLMVALAASGTMVVLAGQAMAADSCLDQVRDMAGRYGMSSMPPTASADGKGEVTTQQLARSGGVIKPPPTDDKSVIMPSPDKHDAMPTVPDIAPQALKAEPAADHTKLQAALTAARTEAEQGNEKGCLEALGRAHTLADRSDSK